MTTCTGAGEWTKDTFTFPKCIKKFEVTCRVPSATTLKRVGLETSETKQEVAVDTTVNYTCKKDYGKGSFAFATRCLETGVFDQDLSEFGGCYNPKSQEGSCIIKDLKNLGFEVKAAKDAVIILNKQSKRLVCQEGKVMNASRSGEVSCNDGATNPPLPKIKCEDRNDSEKDECGMPTKGLLDEHGLFTAEVRSSVKVGDSVEFQCKGDTKYFDAQDKTIKSVINRTCESTKLYPDLPYCKLLCPEGYLKAANGQCYYISQIKLTQFDAARKCNDLSGNIVEVDDIEEQCFLMDLLKTEEERMLSAKKEARSKMEKITKEIPKLNKALIEKRNKTLKALECKEIVNDETNQFMHQLHKDIKQVLINNLKQEMQELKCDNGTGSTHCVKNSTAGKRKSVHAVSSNRKCGKKDK